MRYTVEQFNKEFPYGRDCLQAIFDNRYGGLHACPKCGVDNPKFYRVKGRKSYACRDCGHQLYPLARTIFHKSSTDLRKWFYAIYLFSVSKNGVSAKELERHVGVSYKTAHRMEKQIRKLMADSNEMLGGIVEADETYIGGRRPIEKRDDNKTPVLALASRGGKIKTQVTDKANESTAIPFMRANVKEGSIINTDESKIYTKVKMFYTHESVRHISKIWSENGVHTNNLEGFFSQLKRSLDGTYHAVSPFYLHSYVDEFAFRYNHRKELIFPLLLEQAVKHA